MYMYMHMYTTVYIVQCECDVPGQYDVVYMYLKYIFSHRIVQNYAWKNIVHVHVDNMWYHCTVKT